MRIEGTVFSDDTPSEKEQLRARVLELELEIGRLNGQIRSLKCRLGRRVSDILRSVRKVFDDARVFGWGHTSAVDYGQDRHMTQDFLAGAGWAREDLLTKILKLHNKR